MTVSVPLWPAVLGRFGWQDLPFVRAWENPTISEIIGAFAGALVVVGAVVVAALLTRYGKWRYLWTQWLTSLDHKKIGIMYIVVAFVMLSRALVEAVLMRMQQAVAIGNPGFLSPDHFGQLFSTHGSIMIFFMAMPFLTGMINYVLPLQIGARDMAFPWANSIALWLTIGAAGLMMTSLVVGEFSTGGWSGYPPYTERAFSPGVGVDYWIWAVTLGSIGSTMAGINIACTVYKLRAPGMRFMRMPMFAWTSLCTSILMIFAMPPLTVATLLLALDRYLGFHFFTNDLGGNMMNYANMFWLFGHPEVYILILPAFGVYSEVVSTFSTKDLYGYTSLVIATMAIAVLSFTVWVHHFFTMGQSANVNAAFGIATMTIGVPTGVKIYDWIWTMFRGEVRFTVPMLYAIAFMMTFVLGGFTGIILAMPPLDYLVHNTLFLVAHFHNMLIPGLLYGMLAGYHYWFPKAFGFRLDERWGRIAFTCWVVGFYLAFFPLYVLGASGMADAGDLRTVVPTLVVRRRSRRVHPAGGADVARHPAMGEHPRPRRDTRRGGRPLGWPRARMVGQRTAARIQLRGPAAGRRPQPVLRSQARRRPTRSLRLAAILHGYRRAAGQRDQRRDRGCRRGRRVRTGLGDLGADHRRAPGDRRGGRDAQLRSRPAPHHPRRGDRAGA
jgi:cytochrome o ubiquinol oxidase subunit 1